MDGFQSKFIIIVMEFKSVTGKIKLSPENCAFHFDLDSKEAVAQLDAFESNLNDSYHRARELSEKIRYMRKKNVSFGGQNQSLVNVKLFSDCEGELNTVENSCKTNANKTTKGAVNSEIEFSKPVQVQPNGRENGYETVNKPQDINREETMPLNSSAKCHEKRLINDNDTNPNNIKHTTKHDSQENEYISGFESEYGDETDEPRAPHIGWHAPPLLPEPIPPCPPPQKPPQVDMSQYLQKKSMAQGMMDLALLSANTNQLRYVLDSYDTHPYYLTSLILIVTSLFLQIMVGLCLIWNSRYSFQKKNEMRSADRINNFSVIGIFLITITNVFISTFGGSASGGSENPKPPAIEDASSDYDVYR